MTAPNSGIRGYTNRHNSYDRKLLELKFAVMMYTIAKFNLIRSDFDGVMSTYAPDAAMIV